MLMVVAIVAITAGIAVPRYARALSRYRSEISARRLAADLTLARSIARSSSGSQTIKFFTASSSYQLLTYRSFESATATYTVNLAQEPYRCAIYQLNLSSADQIIFDRYGTPSVGGTIILQSGDYKQTIALDAQTGKATVQ
jgi:type II secretory pathway pseudopilin PulG